MSSENVKRSILLGQIFLDANIAPIELNNLILDYEKPSTNEIVNQIELNGHYKDITIDDSYIYILDQTRKLMIFGKYNYLKIDSFDLSISDDNSRKGNQFYQYHASFVEVDEKNIYVFMTTKIGGGHIRIFTKNGIFERSIGVEIDFAVGCSLDEQYIYIAGEREIIRYNKNGTLNGKKEYMCYNERYMLYDNLR